MDFQRHFLQRVRAKWSKSLVRDQGGHAYQQLLCVHLSPHLGEDPGGKELVEELEEGGRLDSLFESLAAQEGLELLLEQFPHVTANGFVEQVVSLVPEGSLTFREVLNLKDWLGLTLVSVFQSVLSNQCKSLCLGKC